MAIDRSKPPIRPPVTADSAAEVLRDHFAASSPAEFAANLEEFCPKSDEDAISVITALTPSSFDGSQLVLFQPQPSQLPLSAYLASALTGLNDDQRKLVFDLSALVREVCRLHDIDLYEPRLSTDPVTHPDVDPAFVQRHDRERVLSSDLLIHLCHFPSTGAGEELAYASDALVPMVLVSHSEHRISRMITGIPGFKVEVKYSNVADLRHQLDACLIEIRSVLEERKLAFSDYRVNIVGNNVRLLREGLGLTRADVERGTHGYLSAEMLARLEDSVDTIANPNLTQLRALATVLKTTVADLVEPNLFERLGGVVEEVLRGRVAARFAGVSQRDNNAVIRHLLIRAAQRFEQT